jgi:hypothetical protein
VGYRKLRRPQAITLFPKGFDQVIPQVMALFVPYLVLVFPRGRDARGAFVRAASRPVHGALVAVVDQSRQNK